MVCGLPLVLFPAPAWWVCLEMNTQGALESHDQVNTNHSPRCRLGEDMCVKPLQLCLTLCNPMDCSLPGSSVHGILSARILDWVAMPSSSGSFPPRN